MEQGVIESSEPINHMKNIRMINRADENKDEFNLDKPPFGGRASVEVWLCRDCRKIIID